MSAATSTDWPKAIRRYVYQLVALYLVLGLTAIGYNHWQRHTADSLRRLANDYHLASNNHFLKAIEEIRHVQSQLAYRWASRDGGYSQPLPGAEFETSFSWSVSLHLIQQAILSALALQREFEDSQFDVLEVRLENQLVTIGQQLQSDLSDAVATERLLLVLLETLPPLRQLERLHEIEREDLLMRLQTVRGNQTQVFIVLVTLMLLGGFLSTRRVLNTIGVITTDQVESEKQIRMFSKTIEQSPVSVVLTDIDANLVYVNSHFERVSGYRSDEVLGRNLDFLHFDILSHDAHKDIWIALSRGESFECELESQKKNGECITEKVIFAPVMDEAGDIDKYLLVKEDITVRKQQAEQIQYQAHYDSLTDLPNRWLALDRLSLHMHEARRKGEKIALLFLDLDDFKKVNDTLGHETGDTLLIEAAQRLQDVVRSSDTVARLGGDEFVVVLPGLSDSTGAMPIADNLINQFREAFKIDGRDMILTASIGIAVCPDDGDTVSDLLRNADSAMYNAKAQGRNTYAFFTECMNQEVSRRLALEEQMHGALDRGEFHLHYQPKVEVSSGRIIGAEALLRWDNPVLDDVFPNEFIPIAEQTGMIVPIGEFVLVETLRRAATWLQTCGDGFRIGINLSPRQFRDPGLVRFIESALQQSGVAGQCLELEITEGVLMSGHAYIDEALTALHRLGVELTMDDFGKGYSSLSYLRTYPFTTLKIDRDFIEDIAENAADQALVNATIAMAHGLGLKVVAEGVETDPQLHYLRALGCEFAQGYLFGRPVSPEQFTALLEQQDELRVEAG